MKRRRKGGWRYSRIADAGVIDLLDIARAGGGVTVLGSFHREFLDAWAFFVHLAVVLVPLFVGGFDGVFA